MRKQLFLFIFIILSINIVSCETIIYDNLTSSNFKLIKIDDTMNLPIIEYKYEVYIDNQFLGYYSKNENIFFPDNSNITIFIPSPIKTDVTDIYHSYVLPNLYLILGVALSGGVVLIFGFFIIYKVWRNRK